LNGVINLYKEKGITSFGAVAAVRRMLKVKKVGHTGTLDPEAEGVLPICVGKATKLVDYIMNGDKSYRAGFQLGRISDTLDAFGTVEATGVELPSEDEVREKLKAFLGLTMQRPPMYSALKINGKRLYDLAREGIEVHRDVRPITVHSISLENFDGEFGELFIRCSKGTYIRSIIDDLGAELGCGAIMTSLVREGTGTFNMENSVTLGTLESEGHEKYLIPMDQVLEAYEAMTVPEDFYKLIVNGLKIKDRRLTDLFAPGLYRGYSHKGELLGILEREEDFLHLKVNLM